MSSSSRTTLGRHLGWLATLAIFVNGLALAQGDQPQGGQSSVPTTQDQATETSVPEGRSAVDFYRDHAVTDDDPWRLPDEVVQYPVDPVERLQPILEIGDPFLGNGPIQPGIKTPTGQMLQPWFLLFGTFRSAFQSFDSGDENTIEWSNRLDLHGNVNLSGTERLLFSMRPLDRETGGYTGYNFEPNGDQGWQEDFNARLTQLFFEGDFGEIFPGLDPTDSGTFDVGFSIGRQPVLLQDGLLLNDIIDMVGITRNSLVFDGVSNLRMTGVYGWNHINRGNNDLADNNNAHSAHLFGLFSEADTAWDNTVSLDFIYVDDHRDGNAWYVGAASTQRFGRLNTTFRANASIPEHDETPTVGRGVLSLNSLARCLVRTISPISILSGTLSQFTSASRSPDQGSPVANLGILYGPVGMAVTACPSGSTSTYRWYGNRLPDVSRRHR